MLENEGAYVVRAYGTKVCPQCGKTLFDDMDVCFECLHNFGEGDANDQEEPPSDATMVEMPAEDASHLMPEEHWQEDEVPTEAYERGLVTSQEATVAPALQPRMWLRIRSDDVEVSVPLREGGLLVGRGPSCDVVLHARSVSRRHVLLEPEEAGVKVCNQDAKNPAMLGGKKVEGVAHMTAGEELSVCGTIFSLVDA